jgi:hypothetical protein
VSAVAPSPDDAAPGAMASGIDRCRLIALPGHADTRGGLTFVEPFDHVPIDIRRIYYLYDVGAEQSRGAHAHKALEQVFIAVAGAFDVTVDDGARRTTFRLSNPSEGLYLPPGLWRDLAGFSQGAVCLVLASARYDEGDYIRDYGTFKEWARGKR